MVKERFLIEAGKEGIPVFDFQYELINAIGFLKWAYPDEVPYQYMIVKSIDEIKNVGDKDIPVGSVEFSSRFLQTFHNISPKPLNIPAILQTEKFLKRRVFYFNPLKDQIPDNSRYFIKNHEKIKEYTAVSYLKDLPKEDKNYFVSEIIKEIDLEFRCFVFDDKLVDIRRYSGGIDNIKHSPDVGLIQEIIRTYKGQSRAYTLDVGVSKELGTFIIELHNFWSCGLYGFTSPEKLVAMTIQGIKAELNQR